MENLEQENHFKHAFGGRGWVLRKYGSKLRTSEPRPVFAGSYKKVCSWWKILNWDCIIFMEIILLIDARRLSFIWKFD